MFVFQRFLSVCKYKLLIKLSAKTVLQDDNLIYLTFRKLLFKRHCKVLEYVRRGSQ